jgi:ribonuclease I
LYTHAINKNQKFKDFYHVYVMCISWKTYFCYLNNIWCNYNKIPTNKSMSTRNVTDVKMAFLTLFFWRYKMMNLFISDIHQKNCNLSRNIYFLIKKSYGVNSNIYYYKICINWYPKLCQQMMTITNDHHKKFAWIVLANAVFVPRGTGFDHFASDVIWDFFFSIYSKI